MIELIFVLRLNVRANNAQIFVPQLRNSALVTDFLLLLKLGWTTQYGRLFSGHLLHSWFPSKGKILVPVNLLEPHTVLCTTPYVPSLHLLLIAGMCMASYLQYANSTNFNSCLSFSSLGHIGVSSCDLRSFNAGISCKILQIYLLWV